MRELKFRAWDIELREWNNDLKILLNGTIKDFDWDDEGYFEFEVPKEAYVIEQYTGIKDENGREIYEGDIVKYKLYADSRLDYIDEVFYSTISGAFMVGNEDNIRTLDYLINVEVIGNIHENPELCGDEEE